MNLKKGAFGIDSLGPLAVTFVVAAIVIGFSAMVLSDVGDDIYKTYGNTTAHEVIGEGGEALGKFGSWLPTLAIIVVAAIIIAVVVGAFYMGRR